MAFSIRNIISNISYFKKPEESDGPRKMRRNTYVLEKSSFEDLEPDSTSKQYNSLQLPDSVKKFVAKKTSLSDTDILNLADTPLRHKRRRCKKLKVDIQKASQSMNQLDLNIENTPKHVLLESKTSDSFSDRFKGFDFNKSFDIYDEISDIASSIEEEELVDSLSERSSTPKSPRLCRKVRPASDDSHIPSTTPESFADVELDKNEEQRMELLLNYQMKLEKLDCFLKKIFNEFQFHIEVSKVFQSRSVVTALPGSDFSSIPKQLGDVVVDSVDLQSLNSSGCWNIIMEKEDYQTKAKVRKQLLSIKTSIEGFVHSHLNNSVTNKYVLKREPHKRYKKKQKYYDFPDFRDAFLNLFSGETYEDTNCACTCHSQADSGLTSKTPEHSTSISSSIGNFSLDTSKLTAYSESLDQVISYNSFQDSLSSMLLQKATIERITFYIQVHSIQLQCANFEVKNSILFYCPSCKTSENDENDLLKHILSQTHCEKIHFLYKTAYIKKCVSSGKEIQPSTVLNPMTMYRDDNKIVCFGDALYACTFCFENLIVGESVLMAHCADPEHVERREKFFEIID